MTVMRFSDSFWNEDLCSSSGFDVLCKRMRDGKQTMKDYVEFLKSWAQAQENYGKSLIKLSKFAGAKEETGTLKDSWDFMKLKTENIGSINVVMANSLMEEANKTLEFIEYQRDMRKKVEDGVRRIHNQKKTLFKKTLDNQKAYNVRCKEYDATVQIYSDTTKESSASSKDIDKLKAKCMKLKAFREQVDAAYKMTVDNLDQVRVAWEKEVETACEIFQDLEENRISYLRNSLWVFSNVGSSLCVNEDEVYEEFRKNLETCDVVKDIEMFIKKSRTGSVRPGEIPYTNYYENGSNIYDIVYERNSNSSTQFYDDSEFDDDDDSDRNDIEQTDATYDYMQLNNNYESLVENNSEEEKRYLVKYTYVSRSNGEISLTEDSIVTVLSRNNDEWWQVKTDDGKSGYYPALYLQLI